MALTKNEVKQWQQKVIDLLNKAGIVLTEREKETIEIADLGLGNFEQTGVSIVVYHNDRNYCAKELILLPSQTNPQHKHPPIPELNYVGKQETFRCRWGEFYLYVDGDETPNRKATLPQHRGEHYTIWHEIVLRPGEQFTIQPEMWHWFQGGPDGAIVSEFSTMSIDEADMFVDPKIKRISEIVFD